MKKIIKTIILAAACIPVSALAQNLESGYFTDGYLYRYQMNPAFGNEHNFVSMPALGNIDLTLGGNLNLTDVLYNVNGRTTTFMNPNISAAEVLGNLSDHNKLGVNLRLNVLSGGFKAWGGYNTISISARADVNASIPKSTFSLLKEGIENKTYDISDLQARAQAYAEIALGHSRQITDKLRVGANLKFLVGGGSANAHLKDAHLTLGEDAWTITTDAQMEANLKGYHYKTKINEKTGKPYVNGLEGSFDGLNGFGLGLDLGAVYKLNDDWTFSAALLDLGFISWSDTQLATTNGPKTFNSDLYTFSADDNAPNSFDSEWDRMKDGLETLYQLDDMGSAGGRTTSLYTTINLGAEYTFPLYRNLTFGLMNSTRIAGKWTTTDFRLSANVAPCKIFSAGINMAAGTNGVAFGWIANLHPKGFNLFLGMDRTLGRLAKQGVPLTSNASVAFGINFPF
ncbi:MAG: DUF5723 family protein [Prevotella sp.]|nr:DUF5723 family protein [Prevotella sp.]MCM1075550.1 DUF5723 family protein [Ruminococcus sp.]